MTTLEGPGTEQGPPASGVPGALGEGGGLSPRGTLAALTASPGRRAALHGRHHHLGEGQVEGVGSPGDTRGVQELVRVDDGDGSEAVRDGAIDELGDATILLVPAGLQGNRVLLEVVQHV